MRRQAFFLLSALAASLCSCSGFAQQGPDKVMFYNIENFFDTVDDPKTNDDEFTPRGAKHWDDEKYGKKLANIERVLLDIADCDRDRNFPAVIGLAEVENRQVVEDIRGMTRLIPAQYRIVHYDSPDPRGIDVAFLYRPDRFKLAGSAPIRTVIPQEPDYLTRDILTMWGTIDREPFFFMAAHWPSRRGGQQESEFRRVAVAKQMRRIADSVLLADPATKIIAMGDFNDDPTDRSIAAALGAGRKIQNLRKGQFFNPFTAMFKAGQGTLAYGDAWNLFDNIVVTENLVNSTDKGIKLKKAEGSNYWGNIHKKSYLVQHGGAYRGYPYRTFAGNRFLGGYSDHFPVYIYLSK